MKSKSTYPKHDPHFEDLTITRVDREDETGWSVERSDGWSYFISKPSPIIPCVGMKARFYGGGIGSRVRGLFLNGFKIFYRTAEQDRLKADEELFGVDARDWLARWDKGLNVWSITMGGFGPGYEQAIQVTTAEIVRHLIASKYDATNWDDPITFDAVRKGIHAFLNTDKRIKMLGLSGMQASSAVNLATQLYRRGPLAIMKDDRTKDRHIQVSRSFPQIYAA